MKIRLITLIFSLFLLDVFAQPKSLYLKYNLDISYKKVEFKDAEETIADALPTPTHETMGISLFTDGSFDAENTFFDLKNERIIFYTKDTIKNILPLLSRIDNSYAEYLNRVGLSKMLATVGQGNMMGTPLQLESLFGIENEKREVRKSITTKTRKDTTIFLFDKNEIARVHYSKAKMPNEYQKAFNSFFTYNIELHPSIKEKILKTGLTPDYLKFQYYNIGKEISKTFQYESSSVETKSPISINSLPIKIRSSIDSIYYESLKHELKQATLDEYTQEAKKQLDAGNNLSALLCVLECSLSMHTNSSINDLIEQIVAKKEEDAELATFFDCLDSPQTEKEAKTKVEKMQQLMKSNKEHFYVMNIFAGNYIRTIDDVAAETFLLNAVAANPSITGLWSDLGDIYAERFEYGDAWKCYEIMLRLNSEHNMVERITDKKKALRKLLGE